MSVILPTELSLFLGQEKTRFSIQHGIQVTEQDIIRTLLEQHRLRVYQAASEDEALLWYYQNWENREYDITTAATKSAESAIRSLTEKQKGK